MKVNFYQNSGYSKLHTNVIQLIRTQLVDRIWHRIHVNLLTTGCSLRDIIHQRDLNATIIMVWRQNSTSAEEVIRFQSIFPSSELPSWLTSGRTFGHQKLAPTFPWIDNCLMVTKSLKVGGLFMLMGSSCPYP